MIERRGFISSRVGALPPPNEIALELERLKRTGAPLLNLSDSNPVRQGLAPDGVEETLLNAGSYEYDPDPRGLPAARAALATDLACDPERLFLTASTSEAYAWCFKLLCDTGDAILVPKPGYPLFEWLARLEAVKTVYYPLEYIHPHGWMIDTDAVSRLAARHKARILVAINPNNPTGSYVGGDERAALRRICAEEGMALVSDEVFLRYRLESEEPVGSLAADDGCLTFVLDGLSKSLCLPQMKLGWIRICGREADVREAGAGLEIIADSFLSASGPVMHALPALLEKRNRTVANVRERMLRNLRFLRGFTEGTPLRALRCDGGWTALLECPRVMTDQELALALLREEGVLVQPGYFYDIEKAGYLALSLITEPALFAQGVRGIGRLIERAIA